ncbi:MAG TPA: hypothetical protein V6D05_14010 [Stenomitos sp.]
MRHLPLFLALTLTLGGCDLLNTVPKPPTDTTSGQSPTTNVATDSVRPTTTYMYVFNGLGKTIDEINLKTMTVTKGILSTGLYPNQFVTEGATTYLVNSGDANLFKLDLHARAKLDTINLTTGSNPMSLTLLGSNQGLVTNNMTNYVSWIDLATKTQEATESIRGAAGGGAAIANGKAYVPSVEADYSNWPTIGYAFSGIQVYDLATRKLLKTIALADDALSSYYLTTDIGTDPNGKVEVATKTGVVVIDPTTDTVSQTIQVGAPTNNLQFVSATKAYASAAQGMVSFNPTTGAILRGTDNTINSGGGSFKIFGKAAYVANFASDSIRVIDLETEQASGSDLLVGDGPQDLTFITVAD